MRDKPVFGVIVAAGSGSRMGGVIKPLIQIEGRTLFERVLGAFEQSSVDAITVVCPEDDSPFRELAAHCKKPVTFTRGGSMRAESVYNGIMASEGAYAVCVHDCARPFVTAEIIDSVCGSVQATGASCACSAVTDTIRYVDFESGEIYTPDRRHLLSIMTPQAFLTEVYTDSVKKIGDISGFTDECGMLVSAGVSVEYVICPSDNIKLTSPEDITLAIAIERVRKENKND